MLRQRSPLLPLRGHGGLRVVSFASTGDRRFIGADGRTTYALVFPPPSPQLEGSGPGLGPRLAVTLRRALPGGWTVRVTGLDELASGGSTSRSSPRGAGRGTARRLPGFPAIGSTQTFIPLMVFAFLYGLSMDDEVFILARMREAHDRTGSTTVAIVEGLGRTGRLVTSAALILFLAFAALASGPEVSLKVFATGLGAGVLLDATVVRALLVPALVSLFGRWNWWLPAWAARLLRVAPSRARPEPAGERPAVPPAGPSLPR